MSYNRTDPRLSDYADLLRITIEDMINTKDSVFSVTPQKEKGLVSVEIANNIYEFTLAELRSEASSGKKFIKLIKSKIGIN